MSHSRREDVGVILERMIQYSHVNPHWERSAGLLLLLGFGSGCSSLFDRSLFSLGIAVNESISLLEVLLPCTLIIAFALVGLDRQLGIPIRFLRFADKRVLFSVLPSAILFAVRNSIPSYAMALSKKGNMRDFVFCSRLVQPILVFALEGIFTSRRQWKWHVLSMFVLISGVSLFLFHTFDSSVSGSSIPLLGATSNPFATLINLVSAVSGAGYFVLFARQATAKEGDRQWIPLQDLVAFHFIVSMIVQVLLSIFTDTLTNEIEALSDANTEMIQRIMVSSCLHASMLFLRMLCLAKISCTLTSIVPVFCIIPIRMVLGNPVNTTSFLGIIASTTGLISFLSISFTEFSSFGGPSVSWVSAITNMDHSVMLDQILRCVGTIHGVSLFCLVFPIVSHVMFELPISYIIWSVVLFVLPLTLLNHIGIYKNKSLSATYTCISLLMFSFLPLQFGPIRGVVAGVGFAVELVVMYIVGAGLDAIQVCNGFRPGYVSFADGEDDLENAKHEAELDAVISQFVIGDDDDDDDDEGLDKGFVSGASLGGNGGGRVVRR